ncbi:hypothetical protein PS15m_000529 [Mucor circinelloides]
MRSSIRVPTGSDPENTFWMANGFGGGYLGMQHNSGDERRVLFSIWDNDHGSIVDLVEKGGDDIVVEGFGGEGTGAHAYRLFDWKAEQTVHFRTTADVDALRNGTTFSGYYSSDDGNTWQLIATFFAEQQLKWLTLPGGFLENFGSDQSTLKEGYWGNYTLTNTKDEEYQVEHIFFTRTRPLSDANIWEQVEVETTPRNYVYMRIDGSKSEGVYPPTNPDSWIPR